MSVERLLRLADGIPFSPPLPGWSPTVAPRLAREQAHLYLSGVIDISEGKRWCLSHVTVPPHEVDEAIFKAMRESAKAHENAATAVARVLETRYPCAPYESAL